MIVRALGLFLLLPMIAQAGELSANKIQRDTNGDIQASGNVQIKSDGIEIEAERIRFDLDAQSGDLYGATILFDGKNTLQGEYLERIDLETFYGESVLYTPCPDEATGWAIVADEALLDRENGTFEAKGVRFKWAGQTVFYTPAWEHALKRRSGFLMPSMTQSVYRGTETTIPFYWAASPAWDMTFSPSWMSEKGLMSDVEWRHRSAIGSERLQIRSIYDKDQGQQRSRILGEMGWQYTPALNASINIDAVDDSSHLSDFPLADDNLSAPYLTSDATLSWRKERDSAVLTNRYQQRLGGQSNAATLQILPRIQTRNIFDLNSGHEFLLEHQSTLFHRDSGHEGLRVGAKPVWTVPWAFFNDAIQTHWSLRSQLVAYDTNRYMTKDASYEALATSLNVETTFERISEDRLWRHEVKPIVQLDFSDVSDVSEVPLYDSTLQPLTMGNLMNGSRYSGWDRFEQMQRLSMMLDSTLQTKDEKQGVRDVLQGQIGVAWDYNQTPPAQSNILLETTWFPVSSYSLKAGGQHSPSQSEWVESHIASQWHGSENQYVRLIWQKTLASYALEAESLNFASSIKLNHRWSSKMDARYDMKQQQLLSGTLGLLYSHPCWSTLIEGFQTFQPLQQSRNDYGVRLLLEFEGLGSFGG